jgi:Icc-related predicted phosphoesterase
MKKEYFSKLVDEIISEIQKEEDELDEITVTGNVDGYNTPNAFKKTDGTNPDDEPESDYVKRINTGTGYTKVNENRWHQLRKEDSTPNRKIGVGIRTIRKQLSEIELFLNWYSKLKNENGLSKETYWKRTNRHLNAIRERLHNISQRISKL